jgi:hypothetical protein
MLTGATFFLWSYWSGLFRAPAQSGALDCQYISQVEGSLNLIEG